MEDTAPKKNIRISLAIDERTNAAINRLAFKKGLPRSSVIFSIIYQNEDIQKILKDYK